METIRYSPIGLQDLKRGNGKFEVILSDGRVLMMDEIDFNILDGFPFANLPAAGNAGRLIRLTDEDRSVWMDTGTQFYSLTGEVLNVRRFGAKADGSTDDTAAFQAAHDALPSAGGVLYAPKGTYRLNGPVTVTKSLAMIGAGRIATKFQTANATNHMFLIQTADACRFEHLQLTSSVTRTGGAGILLQGAGGNANGFNQFRDLIIDQMWYGLLLQDAYAWTVEGCYFVNNRRNGVSISNTSIADQGDSTLTGCVFDTNVAGTVAAVEYLSSGGLRFLNNKVLGHVLGFLLEIATGAATSNLLMIGNSIEGQSSYGILCQRPSGSGTFGNILIADNQLAGQGNDNIAFSSATGAPWDKLLIENNFISVANTFAGIRVNNAENVAVQGNHLISGGASANGIEIASAALTVRVGRNWFYGTFASRINNLASNPYVEPMPTSGTVSVDPGSIAATTIVATDVTIAGLKTTDTIFLMPPAGLNSGLAFVGNQIPSANTVRIYLYNTTGSPIDDSARTWQYTWFDRMNP